MVDLAKEAFTTNNFDLAADIFERTIRENGPKSEFFLGLADSLARAGQFSKAFNAYTNAYRYGKVTPEKLKHLVVGLINTVKRDIQSSVSSGSQPSNKKGCMFTCGLCKGLLSDPVTIPCGHSFCRKCLEKDKSKTCDVCGTVHYKLKLRNLKSNVVLVNLIGKWFPNECTATSLKRIGNDFMAKRDFEKAIDVYSQAIEKVPFDHLLLSNRCHAYASLDQYSEALVDAEKVVRLRPDWPKGYFRKGCANYGLGKYEDAVVAFLQCLALDEKVSSAKDYLSKALDKILSKSPPDDPKAQSIQQARNPTMLHQLIQTNFSRVLLLPDISHTLNDLAQIVKDTIEVASNFNQESVSHSVADSLMEDASQSVGQHPRSQERVEVPIDTEDTEMSEKETDMEIMELFPSQKIRCNSMPDCSAIDHEALIRATMPRSYSPRSGAGVSRKRYQNFGPCQGPVSPTDSSPQKVLKSTISESTPTSLRITTSTPTNNATAPFSTPLGTTALEPTQTSVEDLECGLCYRLYYEPVTTPCGHTFCKKCLDRCLDHTDACPMCKSSMSEYLAERRTAVTDAVQTIIETFFKKEFVERCKINDEEMTELTKMGGQQQSEIPVFVCTMGFPTIPCPLHIFEPRYRLMVRQCMESGTRQFGMCAAIDEQELSEFGCMLEIRDVQYFPDGRSLVDTTGGRRFRVLSKGQRDGYDTAKVEFIADYPLNEEELPEMNSLNGEIHTMLEDWVRRLPEVHRTRITNHFGQLPPVEASLTTTPNGPSWLWWAIAVLPIDPTFQMMFLGMVNLRERMNALKRVLQCVNRQGPR